MQIHQALLCLSSDLSWHHIFIAHQQRWHRERWSLLWSEHSVELGYTSRFRFFVLVFVKLSNLRSLMWLKWLKAGLSLPAGLPPTVEVPPIQNCWHTHKKSPETDGWDAICKGNLWRIQETWNYFLRRLERRESKQNCKRLMILPETLMDWKRDWKKQGWGSSEVTEASKKAMSVHVGCFISQHQHSV